MNNISTFKTLNTIFYALLAGMIFFGGVFYFLVSIDFLKNKLDYTSSNLFFIVALCVTVGGIFLGNSLYKKQLASALKKSTINEKLAIYKSGTILKFSLIEGAFLFCCIAYFLTANQQLFYIMVILLVVYFLAKPTKEKMANELQLKEDEKHLI